MEGADAGSGTPLRVMAANLTSGNQQSYDPGHGIRIMQGLKPDVILVQEFNYRSNSAADIQAMVDLVCNPGCTAVRESEDGDVIPNGVISRWPILRSGEWPDPEMPNRDFMWAEIDIPGTVNLWAVSLHLPTDATKRRRSADALVAELLANVPSTDLLVVGGDLNTDSKFEYAVTALDGVLETEVFPVDQQGAFGTSASRDKPYDRVMPNDELERLRVATVIGANVFPRGLVFDSQTYNPLSDVAPVERGDSGASNMQHMGVVKDFVIPAAR